MESSESERKQDRQISRRQFIGASAAGISLFTIVPRHVLGGNGHIPPSDKPNIALVGVGGRGCELLSSGLETLGNIVALCDVEHGDSTVKYAVSRGEEYYASEAPAQTFARHPEAKKYQDFRKMLEKEDKNIDAVVVATPDHTHAVITMMALKMDKHVYCEKPLTHTVYEARKITEAARTAKVATQMGIQGHSSEGARLINEWIWDGAIGMVREAHVWTDRPLAFANSWYKATFRPQDTPPVPEGLDWDLWLGPAPQRPFHPIYLPGCAWRPWFDFGSGSIGDMMIHNMDPVYWAMKLDQCKSFTVSASYSKMYPETYPHAILTHYTFPARGDMPPLQVHMYDGGLMPPRPEELEPGRSMGENGVLFVGDKGKMLCGGWSSSPRLIPESRMKEYVRPAPTLSRSIGHIQEWIEACKNGTPTGADFAYAGPYVEIPLMGNVAVRTGRNIELHYDVTNMQVTNVPEANQYLQMEYRNGWSL